MGERNGALGPEDSPMAPRPLQSQGLFPSEAEIARRLSQDTRSWAAKAIILERDGFPRIDAFMGGRYWPAVIAWWNRRYGLSIATVAQQDGRDNLDALR